MTQRWVAWIFFALVLIGWQAGSSAGVIDSLFLPSPLRIADSLGEMIASGDLFRHLGASLMRIGAGWFIGSIAGVIMGGFIGLSWMWRSAGLPFISALFPVPKIALLPLLILWCGIGETSKIATIALGVFFPMAVSTYAGIDNVQRNLIRMAQSFNIPFPSILVERRAAGHAAFDPVRLPHQRFDRAHPGGVGGDDRRPDRHRRPAAPGRQSDADRSIDGGDRCHLRSSAC